VDSFTAESTILTARVLDRSITTCSTLRYTTVFMHVVIAKIGQAALARSFCMMFPTTFLLLRLPFCGHNVMPHIHCEHKGIAACPAPTSPPTSGMALPPPSQVGMASSRRIQPHPQGHLQALLHGHPAPGSWHLQLSCVCYINVLHTGTVFMFRSLLWPRHPLPRPHPIGQPLHAPTAHVKLRHLHREKQASQGKAVPDAL
ncbi:hypothetical protein CIB84_015460, partial [Bambusicola thoracicus]